MLFFHPIYKNEQNIQKWKVCSNTLNIKTSVYVLNFHYCFIIIIIKRGHSARLRESDTQYTLSVRRPQPHNTNL